MNTAYKGDDSNRIALKILFLRRFFSLNGSMIKKISTLLLLTLCTGTSWCQEDLIKDNSFFAEDTLFLKDGKIHTGVVIKETPRIIVIKINKGEKSYKRHLVKNIQYATSGDSKKVKLSNERSYQRYENYPIDMGKIEINIAVYSLTSNGVSPWITEQSADAIRKSLSKKKQYNVISKHYMSGILKEQNFPVSDYCDDLRCAVKVGKILGVDQIIIGNIRDLGGSWSVKIRKVSVTSKEILQEVAKQFTGSENKLAAQFIPEMVADLDLKRSKSADKWWVYGGAGLVTLVGILAYMLWASV